MYITDYSQYYDIVNLDEFEEELNKNNLDYIKSIFRPNYEMNLLETTLQHLYELGLIEKLEEAVPLIEVVEFFKNYIISRFGEDVYNNMIQKFEINFDYKLLNSNTKNKYKYN